MEHPTTPLMRSLCTSVQLMVALICCMALVSCASTFNHATNIPLPEGASPNMGVPTDIVGENAIALSFSGGGLRAAAFAHGVLTALQDVKTADGDLLNDVVYISSVSGGSLTAAYYGVYGREGLARFRDDVLLRDFEHDMRVSMLNPRNVARVFSGGLNVRENFVETLDRDIFHGATFADIYRQSKPDIRIHATDLYHRITFPFIPRVFALLCSDLRSYKVADAVGASMAVPLVFAPVVVRSFPDDCHAPSPIAALNQIASRPDSSQLVRATAMGMAEYRDPKRGRFVKLVDGGLTDNFGVSSFVISRAVLGAPYAPMTQRDAVKIRRLLFIVVNAALEPGGDWTLKEKGPSGIDLALYSTDAATDASARLAADALNRMLHEWQKSVVHFRCGLKREEVVRLGGPKKWNCADVKFSMAFVSSDKLEETYRKRFGSVPTRLTLKPDQIDAAIKAGQEATLALPSLREYLHDRGHKIEK